MKTIHFGILVFFFIHEQGSNAAVVRKQPAYATPIYSNSYLPAAMQVIFHAVGQLKNIESDEAVVVSTTTTTTEASVPVTSPHAPGQHQPIPENPTNPSITNSEASVNDEVEAIEFTASVQGSTISTSLPSSDHVLTASSSSSSSSSIAFTDSPTESIDTDAITSDDTANTNETKAQEFEAANFDIKAETPEENYATPEIDHEIKESVQEIQEPAQEMTEANEETAEGTEMNANAFAVGNNGESIAQTTTISAKRDSSEEKSSEESGEETNSFEESKDESGESKSSKESKQEKLDSSEEEDEEIRFSIIGEKVSQAPRPSLSNYLKKTMKTPLRSSIEELSSLYDILSKDARRQGLAKYSGYSDEVLGALKSSAEGGIVPQLRILFEKTLERKELTRDDAKSKLTTTLKNLSDPSTILNRDLRGLIPLRYAP